MLTEPNVGGRQKTRSIARRASNAAVLQSSLFCVERMCLVKNITKKEAVNYPPPKGSGFSAKPNINYLLPLLRDD